MCLNERANLVVDPIIYVRKTNKSHRRSIGLRVHE